jgi:hypothetical protein
MSTRETMQQALDALELPCDRWNKQQHMIVMKASDALRAELAKPAGVSTRKVLEDLVLWVYANAHWGCTPLEVIYAQAELAKPEPVDIDRLRIGHDRYEAARRMNPRQWADAWHLNLTTGKQFDQIIDDLMPFLVGTCKP